MGKINFQSLWVWWAITTVIYMGLNLSGHGMKPNTLPSYSFLDTVTNFTGVFVPYGLTSLFLFFSPFGLLSVLVFALLMVYTNKKLNERQFNIGTRIFFNLLALMLITMAVDFVRLTPFFSWTILFTGVSPYHD